MANYCVDNNAQANGDHEVHNRDARCPFEPTPINQLFLGSHSTCSSAVTKAKQYYPKSNGCAACASACHTS